MEFAPKTRLYSSMVTPSPRAFAALARASIAQITAQPTLIPGSALKSLALYLTTSVIAEAV